MKTILFQGDSITDACRTVNVDNVLGSGYASMVAAKLGFENPGKYNFINRGIGGNRSIDVYARIKSDIINLKPDYISILVGGNDVWHEFSRKNGLSASKYEKIYCMMIEEIKEALPDVKIMILEPFCLCGPETEDTAEYPDRWNFFHTGIKEIAEKAKAVAQKYGLPFIELQDKFDEAAKTTGNTYWLADGVHPTAMGHELIKREWIKAFNKL